MKLGLENKRALVLASSRGLGFGIAKALVEEGANVVLTGRSEALLAEGAEQLNALGQGKAFPLSADLKQENCAQSIFDGSLKELGGIDILVNNTGGPPPGEIASIGSRSWIDQFEMMVLRVMEITNLCIPAMQAAGEGRILTLGSSGVVQPIPNLGMSNTLRSALVGWTKTLSTEIAGDGITVNMLIPGRIHTERVDELDAAAAKRQRKSIEEVATASRGTIPAGRYGRVEEFAAVAAFLVSEKASYVTGSVVRCDGGLIRSV